MLDESDFLLREVPCLRNWKMLMFICFYYNLFLLFEIYAYEIKIYFDNI